MTVPDHSLPYSRRSAAIAASLSDLAGFESDSTWARRKTEPGISDFTFGNPHEMPLADLVNALQAWSTPLNKDWYAYKSSEQDVREVAAAGLSDRTGLTWAPDDLAMTNAGIAALMIGIRTVVEDRKSVV